MKRCPDCGETKSKRDFYRNKRTPDGASAYCKVCVKRKMAAYYVNNKDDIQKRRNAVRSTVEYREQASKRSSRWAKNNPGRHWAHVRARRLRMKVTSFVSERNQVEELYKNCPPGFHVDHIIPLKHPLVCGLHVIANLQCLPARENDSKGNKFEVASNG